MLTEATDFLQVIPDPRTAGIGYCGVALTDLGPNTWFNPSCLAYSPRPLAAFTAGDCSYWITWPVAFARAAASIPLRSGLVVGASATYTQVSFLSIGDSSIFGDHPSELVSALSAGYRLSSRLALGVSVKPMLSHYWVYQPENAAYRGVAVSAAIDAGTQYQPWSWLGTGLSLTNLGPALAYGDSEQVALPITARVGCQLKPRIPGPVALSVLFDVWRNLEEYVWRDTLTPLISACDQFSKGIGLELRFAGLASIRAGYVEDLSFPRGGVIVRRNFPGGGTELWEISMLRYLFRRPEGFDLVDGIGLTWGVGLEYRGIAVDLGYDTRRFLLRNSGYRLQLVARF